MRFRLSSETLEILTSHIRFAKILVNVLEDSVSRAGQ